MKLGRDNQMVSNFQMYKEKQELCEFYSNPNDLSKFCVGYIVDYDKNYCLIACLDPYGNKDGFCCFRTDDIIKIQTGTQYLRSLEKLLKYYKDENYYNQQLNFRDSGNSLLKDVYCFIKKENKISSFEVLESNLCDFCGIISEISDDVLIIQIITDHGYTDGTVQIDIDAISSVTFDSCDEQKISILYSLGLEE